MLRSCHFLSPSWLIFFVRRFSRPPVFCTRKKKAHVPAREARQGRPARRAVFPGHGQQVRAHLRQREAAEEGGCALDESRRDVSARITNVDDFGYGTAALSRSR